MNPSRPNLEKQLLVDSELKDLFDKYILNDTERNRTPYGILGLLIELGASYEDLNVLHMNTYFSDSLLRNNNRWS